MKISIKNFDIQKHKDLILIITFILFITFIILLNFLVDPYYVFNSKKIQGFNHEKTFRYANKRTNTYSNIKINGKNKQIVFSGNCLLYDDGSFDKNIGFFTIPVAKIDEVSSLIENMYKINPKIKKIYWGMFYDDFYNEKSDEVTDFLPELDSEKLTINDVINLFFSWNTTKYTLLTIKDSIKNKESLNSFIYPYRELAHKKYEKEFSFSGIEKISKIKQYCKDKNIELVIYYSPIHISKKVDLFNKKQWNSNLELKRKIASITPFYDYSLFNKYNSTMLDENNKYYIDNIHPDSEFNNILVNDLLSEDKKIGILLDKNNIEKYLKKDSAELEKFIKNNKDFSQKLKTIKPSDAEFFIRRKNAF